MLIAKITLILSTAVAVSAFVPNNAPFLPSFSYRAADLRMSAPTEMSAVPIVISGNNIEVTPALMDYVNKKLEVTLGKLSSSGAVRECDVHLSVNKNPKVENNHKVEVVTMLKGTTIRAAETTPDMYSSIDKVVDRVARKLRQYKERKLKGYHSGPHMGENIANVLDSIEDVEEEEVASETFVDPEAPTITKIKSFDLSKAISVEEAVFALDYIDHDFYVFKDEATSEVSVVYKRNAGGVGLIQPSAD